MRADKRDKTLGAVLGSTAGALSVCAAAWIGCSVYDVSLLQQGALTTDGDTPVDPTIDAGPDAPDPCLHARWPERPAADSPDAGASSRFVGALRKVSLGGGKVDAGLASDGYDLDNVCTCLSGAGSCKPRAATDVCDNDGGRDNSAGELFRALGRISSSATLLSDDGLNERLEAGDFGMLLEVRDYNGALDDKEVIVALYPSNGVADADGGPTKARWDGTDVWTRDPDGLIGGGTAGSGAGIAKYADEKAYVANGTIVAKINFPLSLGAAGAGYILLDLSGGVLIGKIVKQGDTYRIDQGQIVGRWATAKLLTALAVYTDPILGAPQHLCGDNPTYQTIKTRICDAVDTNLEPARDNAGTDCNALSIAVGFAGSPATIGPIRERTPDTPGGATEAGPWRDECPK